MLRRMLKEHRVTDDLISSEGPCVLPLCGINFISESILCSLSSRYISVISPLTMPCLSVISAFSRFSGTELGF